MFRTIIICLCVVHCLLGQNEMTLFIFSEQCPEIYVVRDIQGRNKYLFPILFAWNSFHSVTLIVLFIGEGVSSLLY